MIKNISCACGKRLGTKCLETQEIVLSTKTLVVDCKYGDVKMLCPYCNNTVTEVGKISR